MLKSWFVVRLAWHISNLKLTTWEASREVLLDCLYEERVNGTPCQTPSRRHRYCVESELHGVEDKSGGSHTATADQSPASTDSAPSCA